MQGAEKLSVRFYSVIVVIILVILPELISGQDLPNGDEFTFVRLQYSSDEGDTGRYGRRFRRRRSSWAVDYPFAERNFMRGLESFTSLNVSTIGRRVFQISFCLRGGGRLHGPE